MIGNYNTALRIVQAGETFAETVAEIAGLTKAEGFKVLAAYRKAKVVKLDAVNGRYTVKHGAFFDVDVIRRAVNS